jgi:hypothetical protein
LHYSPQSETTLYPFFSHFNGSEWEENGIRMVSEWEEKCSTGQVLAEMDGIYFLRSSKSLCFLNKTYKEYFTFCIARIRAAEIDYITLIE